MCSLSDGEWKIMKVLWREQPQTVGQLTQALDAETGWSRTTIFIMLKRLISKGAVRLDDSGRVQVYYAEITREEIEPEETSSFLSRVFDGSLGMMVSSLVSHRALSEEELSELRNILDEAEKSSKP